MFSKRNLVKNITKSIKQPGYALQVASRRSKSYLTYHLRDDGYSAYPETISLFLTYRCNLRCYMCGQWGDEGAFKSFSRETLRDGLSLETLKNLIDDIASFRPNITLFGGEPMLYRDWIKVVEHIKSHDMRCNIVTNGMQLEMYAHDIVQAGLDEIILSLDGVGEVHDNARGVPGAYDKLYSGVTAIRKFQKTLGKSAPILNINCTISEVNYQNLDALVDAVEVFEGDIINFHHLLHISDQAYQEHDKLFRERFNTLTPDWKGFVWKPNIDPEILIDQLKKVEARKSPVNILVYPNFTDDEIRQWYTEDEFRSTSYANRCMSVWMTVYIFPNGDVRPYHSMNFVAGNIHESSFKEIWNNEKFKDYRKFLKKRKAFPVCYKGCTELYRY
ncbi:MAG: radical SAM protein [Candidatus Poribacteria bacterium]|nr:radical SAM protein [Candidatus Poribacteria bacterium]